ncbi:MAG TPA: PQQ-dependent sugar dehydrogenase [Acidimicrobiia bacterium]|nr:PQQ-dependent sugar dehydrogenase [Acidimicrobiia bacterium]
MTARHRESPSPDQARYRVLLVVLLAVFLIAFLILRVLGAGGDDDPGAVPGSTTTIPGDGGTAEGDGGSTTTPSGAGGSSTTTGGTNPDLAPLQEVTLDLVFDGFRQPNDLAAPPGDDRLFVVQRVGVIRILDANRTMLDPAFLDLTDQVLAGGIEQGMLGLAFHPDYANNGRFFVYFTDKSGNRQLSEFTVSATDPNIADVESEKVIFEYPQPEGHTDIRHYAGNVEFGPDGYLWVSMGDGADSRDQGQDPNTPYGTIVRIDVDNGDPYAIPPDNPFVDGGGLADVWAYGLRNPWRFSIDAVDGLVYVADVGHADQEEVNVVPLSPGGYNFGWSDMEGTRCFHLQDCNAEDYTSPVITYTHEEGLSITGGYVYRGEEIPELHGTYFYSDWVRQWIRGFEFVDGQVTEARDWTEDLGGPVGSITSFGLDGHGELYVTTYEGAVYKFTAVR